MVFEDLPTVPTAEELVDKAFSRAARAGRSTSGVGAQRSMLQTASNVLADNLANVVTTWPDFDDLHPFHYELADALVDVDEVRQALGHVGWAGRQTKRIGREAQRGLPADAEGARRDRKRAFARMASVVREVGDDLERLGEAHQTLRRLPAIDPDVPTVVVAGFPNVGKSSFVNAVTNARNEIAEYPFTTTRIQLGHVDRRHVRYQLVDTPGLLDRPVSEQNEIEAQARSALVHLADCVLFLVDASGTCGYPLEEQLALRASIGETFDDVPVLTVCNKADLSTDVPADLYMSVETGRNVDAVVEAAVEAIGHEPALPHVDREG